MKKTTLLFCICAFLTLVSTTMHAQDRFLAYTAQSNVLPKGTREVELWYANQHGGNAFYNSNYIRTGFKMGFGNNFIAGYYFNVLSKAYVENGIDPTDKVTRVYGSELSEHSDYSFSAYAKMKFLDPVANPIGLAVEVDYTIGAEFSIFSPKLIIDKRFGDNYVSFNSWVAFHKETILETTNTNPNNKTAPTVTSFKEPQYEFDLAYMRFLKSQKIGLGFEVRTHSESTEEAGLEHIVLFGGPAVHLRGDKWFLNLSVMPQWGNLHKTWIAPDSKVLDEHQNFELRTMLGFMF